ncbi:MAG TPA: alcohol dehydrogenase catalytic domain-containing protein [Solirubrobacteraceae bacterium]|nr:alcohol dehydrogenase catalytic domain-containing protein [Solirubrobacteraceae bacterium]
MRAAVFHQHGGPLAVEEVPDPAPPRDGVVVEVGATGICRSDWHAWQGHDPDVAPPHVPGHELAGTVVAAGPEVGRVALGDRVTVPFCLGCGRCGPCRAGETQVCDYDYQPGFTGPGSWARYVALPHADLNVVALPDELDMVAAAALGCRFMTAWAAVRIHGRVLEGEWVAVHGCGGVGLSAVMIAAAAGARVVAVDIDREKLGRARQLGAEAAVDARAGGVEAVLEATGGGAHVSLDALGSAETSAASVSSLRKRGRHVQVGLMLAGDRVAPVPMARVISHELSLHGVHGMAVRHYPQLLAAVAARAVDPAQLVGTTIPLERAGAELEAMGAFARTGATVITSF